LSTKTFQKAQGNLHKELNPEEEIFVRFDDAGTG
jgi:hypothetical protein